MVWAMNKTPNRYFFKADEISEVRMAPADEVVAFIKQNPDVMFNLVSRLYSGIDSLLERIVYLMSGSARSRIIYELVIEANRFGTKITENCYKIHISESDLGARVGVARETVSREVKHLKDKGLVEIVAGNIILKDLASLKAQLGQVA
jgi:CRP/FNR family transcriptional regulator